jgi:ATP-dependent Clp protease ATP-binding subunit ClpA
MVEGPLSPAFEVDEIIDQFTECILAGRNPIITGESGIGKTSIIHELVRRIASGQALLKLRGWQVLQLSFRRRASGLKQPNSQMRPEMQKLLNALLDQRGNVDRYLISLWTFTEVALFLAGKFIRSIGFIALRILYLTN